MATTLISQRIHGLNSVETRCIIPHVFGCDHLIWSNHILKYHNKMSIYKRNKMKLFVFPSHFHSPDHPADHFPLLWICLLTATSCLSLSLKLLVTQYIWSSLSYHTEMDRNYRALLLWDTLHQSLVLLPVLPGNQKRKAPPILYPGYFSVSFAFHFNNLDRVNEVSLLDKEQIHLLHRLKKKKKAVDSPKLSVPQQKHNPTHVQLHLDTPYHPCGPWGQGGTDTSKLMFGLFGMPLWQRTPLSSASMEQTATA